MTVGELMNLLIQGVDCDAIDTDTQIIFCVPTVSEGMCNFKPSKIGIIPLGANYCKLTLK